MMFRFSRFMKGLLACACLLHANGMVSSACAQAWPAKPIRLVIGFPPGSAADVVARMVAPRIGEGIGQQVLIEHKPGAGSSIAAEGVVRAAPDGYTLLLGSAANIINTSINKNLTFDFARDLAPIAPLAILPTILVVHPSVAARTVPELIAVARAKAGEMSFGSSGNGTVPHLSGELFNTMTGVKLVHVPYKGTPQAVTDLLSGRIQLMFSPASTVLPHIKAGSLRALASTGSQRSSVAADLPTVAEAGVAGFETALWFALMAPAATPPDILDRLQRESSRVLALAELKAQFAAQGIDTMAGSREQLAAYIRQETEKWARVVQVSGARSD